MRPSEPRTPWLQGRRPVACIASRNTLRMDLAQDLEAVIQPSIRPASCRRARAASATTRSTSPSSRKLCATALTSVPVTAISEPVERRVDISPHLVARRPVTTRAHLVGESLESEVSPRRPSNTGEVRGIEEGRRHVLARVGKPPDPTDVARSRRHECARLNRLGEPVVRDLQERDRRLSVGRRRLRLVSSPSDPRRCGTPSSGFAASVAGATFVAASMRSSSDRRTIHLRTPARDAFS